MKIYIKNMVCERCKIVLTTILQKLSLQFRAVTLGEIDFGEFYGEQLDSGVQELLNEQLEAYGFELLNSKKSKIVEEIKRLSIEFIQKKNELESKTLSSYLTKKLPHHRNVLSQLFSSVEGITIEQYFIKQRIEKVKELLVYDELSLSEIAYQLDYSSVAHLSRQFKKITGLTPSYFREQKDLRKRSAIDEL